MSVPSMVHRSGDSLIVRSVVSGNTLYGNDLENDTTIVQSTSTTVIEEKDLPECKVKRNYSCNSCDFYTQNPRHYLYHLRDVHEEKVRIYECPNCLYASKHFQKLLRHTKMVHGNGESFDISKTRKQRTIVQQTTMVQQEQDDDDETIQPIQQTSAQQDLDDFDDDRSSVLKCSVCSFTARNRSQLSRHEREEHIKTKFFRCTKCTYVTHMKARFTKHVKYHSMPMIKCDMCDFRTPYKWNLDRHCKNHNGNGAFRCSACNFTADIKQSLTVHEMNHHVPPVGQAAGLGVGRRRNKVGASDATAAEEAAAAATTSTNRQHLDQNQVVNTTNVRTSEEFDQDEEDEVPLPKKQKIEQQRSSTTTINSEFIHPDDIIHHSNGNVYIKNKCKLCNFKSAWPNEMAKHEMKIHNINNNDTTTTIKPKKTLKPIPNLIPIPTQTSAKTQKLSNKCEQQQQQHQQQKQQNNEPIMSQQDYNDICAKSANSTLKDLASLFDSEDVFQKTTNKPEIEVDKSKMPETSRKNDFKQKNTSFFDKLKEKLMNNDSDNLICKYCGHENKCLTEQIKHQKQCSGKIITNQTNYINKSYKLMNIKSSRCQYCRQRCKSSTDLYNHMLTCDKAIKEETEEDDEDSSDVELKINEEEEDDIAGTEEEEKPHPMENRVFVWNNIVVPMDIEVDDSNYEYIEDKVDDNISLDLSIRTQSPEGCSDNSFTPTPTKSQELRSPSSTMEKIPTHGTDISVAQHKRVFKCPHCSFWASTASRFHVHIVGHLNKKPFECSLCAYRSNWRWDITKHIKLKSVRDPQHETAKVLMTDETGRRNYTKYNKYLTEIHVSGDQSMETSGGSGTRPKSHHHDRTQSPNNSKELPKLVKAPDFSPSLLRTTASTCSLRPLPPLKAADGTYFAERKQRNDNNSKRTLFKCKKCNFRDASRDILLAHVKEHYNQQNSGTSTPIINQLDDFDLKDEASTSTPIQTTKGGLIQAPFRCGHCNQVSNWKHVIQRHCRLKHSGDIRVVSNKNGQEKLEIEEQIDEPDHIDIVQDGTFKCNSCPFSTDSHNDFKQHLTSHLPSEDSIMKCHYCNYFVSKKADLFDHLKLHGIIEPEEFFDKLMYTNDSGDKRFKCLICPYVTNSKSQYTYHKQFHKPRNGQYTCTHCTYNVSKRHLLHQHLKVHGINIVPQKQNGEIIDLDDISDEIEEISSGSFAQIDTQHFPDIPLVWVSKNGKFSKMFKCRYCPHVNLRKVNIQEHEKMHSVREKTGTSSRNSDIEHRCSECNYICNNAGVLSSHSKVHQGLYGQIHGLVDPIKTDEEQIYEFNHINDNDNNNNNDNEDELMLFFCKECPARFLRENEYLIHSKLHGIRLFYKCTFCTYSARQKPHLLAHNKVHTNEYQERTKELQTMYIGGNVQPQTYPVNNNNNNNEVSWIVYENSNNNDNGPVIKVTTNVPLSGTELYQQKAEAQQKHKEFLLEHGSSMNGQDMTFSEGNPEFIYPTYLKNGRMKEKRYKCHKCPSAFEKREQYKIHLNLHGSKQRYKCEYCDYSVKYYANYVQHLKKHKMNSDAQLLKNNDEVTISNNSSSNEENGLSIGDQQAFNILQKRLMNPCRKDVEETIIKNKLFWCPICPYVNARKDSVDNHQKRHIIISGNRSNFTCDHCDYSVPQLHFLKEHVKLHFLTNKYNQIDAFMICDNMKLLSKKIDDEQENELNENKLVFDEKLQNDDDILQRFNNNDGEKLFVNLETGEINDNDKSISDKMDES